MASKLAKKSTNSKSNEKPAGKKNQPVGKEELSVKAKGKLAIYQDDEEDDDDDLVLDPAEEDHVENEKKKEEIDGDAVDQEELAEEIEASAASASKASAETAAVAEISTSFKNFRHHPDMENFYRFIYENDLRIEAAQIIDQLLEQKRIKRGVPAKATK